MIRRAFGKLARMSLVDRSKLAVLFEQDHLRQFLAEFAVDCVFDVGANVGQYASMLRREAKYQGRIISFEPLVNEFRTLERVSKSDELWDVERIGITASGGMRTFKVMKASQFSSFSDPISGDTDKFASATTILERPSVDTLTLAAVYEKYHRRYEFQRPFLKLDTQGLDVEIVTSNKSILQKFVGFQSELAVKKIYEQSEDFKRAIAIYSDLGFELSALVPNNAGHFPTLIEIDCIMIRRDLADRYLRLPGQAGDTRSRASA
jgi:FkbM family methyltransferase